MDKKKLIATAQEMVASSKGLIAMDESNPTCNKRFEKLGIPQTVEARHAYRELIITTPNFNKYISSMILSDETIRQSSKNGMAFPKMIADLGIIPGIKVDMGTVELAGHPSEKITEGLDGLRKRLEEYAKLGARFAKWRAVITIDKNIPSKACIKANAHILALYAALCQEAGIVPIVEPEVLMDGNHTIEQCYDVTEKVLLSVFKALRTQNVLLEGMILKPNMVLPGKDCPNQKSTDEIADATIKCFLRNVPAAVAGIAFLSGGQSAKLASERLNAMNVRFKSKMPWGVSFSYSRAIQQPALDFWKGNSENLKEAQKILCHRAKCNWAARHGEYSEEMEKNNA